MQQLEIDRLVAEATGESMSEVRRLGFSLADPMFVEYDPEPSYRSNSTETPRWLADTLTRV